MNGLDRQLALWLNHQVGGSATAFELALDFCGTLPLVVVVTVLLALWWTDMEGGRRAPVLKGSLLSERSGLRDSRRRCVALALGIAGAFIITRLMAFGMDRSRPLGVETLRVPIDPGRWQDLVTGMTGFGAFPSDHAALFFAMGTGLWFWGSRAGIAGILAAVFFSTVRVAVGFHYPSDMIVGALIGSTLAVASLLAMRRSPVVVDAVIDLFHRWPSVFYPLLFVAALDFVHHFRLVLKAVFAVALTLLGGLGEG